MQSTHNMYNVLGVCMYDVSDLVVAVMARGHVVDPLRFGTNNIYRARECQ